MYIFETSDIVPIVNYEPIIFPKLFTTKQQYCLLLKSNTNKDQKDGQNGSVLYIYKLLNNNLLK